ncbi:MAG: CNNM domain-containing protein [Bacteroidales bacterium]
MNEIIIILILILFNGALAMSEIALISVRKTYLTNEAKRGNKNARLALRIIESPDKFLSTIQIGITIIGILTGIYSGSVLADRFSAQLILWGVPAAYSHMLAQGVIVGIVTYFSLIFGELVPKRIGMSVAEKTTKIVARPMYYLSVIASPFVWLLSKSTSFVFRLLGLKSSSGKITEEEIRSMIQEGAREGEVQEVEQDIPDRFAKFHVRHHHQRTGLLPRAYKCV